MNSQPIEHQSAIIIKELTVLKVTSLKRVPFLWTRCQEHDDHEPEISCAGGYGQDPCTEGASAMGGEWGGCSCMLRSNTGPIQGSAVKLICETKWVSK